MGRIQSGPIITGPFFLNPVNHFFFFFFNNYGRIQLTHHGIGSQILILHMKKIMNSIIEMVENKIKPKPQFINEKISKFLNLKKKK